MVILSDIVRARYAEKAMPIDPVALTRQLVDIESITENEAAVGHFLTDFLSRLGYQVEKTAVPRTGGGERFNVYGSRSADAPVVVLSTHIDTVPPFYPSREDDSYIYGRGSCDAKGIVAAQILAAERLREQGIHVGLLFLAGEERGSHGAKVANLSPKGSRFLINGEPTDNRLALASKGSLNAIVRSHGKMAHSAYPELGDSAIHKLVRALDRILRLHLPTDPEAGASTLNIGVVEGGYAPNVIADKASATILVRLIGASDEIRSRLQEAAAEDAEVEVTLEIKFQKLKKVEGLSTMVAAFTTDIPALSNWGEPLLLGPGSIHVAHTPDERLSKREQREAIDLYTQIVQRLVQESA
jgi:acetylornithine deacetylase